jgi:hypothetical protein
MLYVARSFQPSFALSGRSDDFASIFWKSGPRSFIIATRRNKSLDENLGNGRIARAGMGC